MTECACEQNKANCNCTYGPCKRKGTCCKCLEYHRRSGELPACFFPNDVERTYDRSVRRFVDIFQKRGRW